MQEVFILKQVKELRKEHKRMGAEKLHHLLGPVLQKHNIKYGRDKFYFLLREHGLLVRRSRRGPKTTNSNHFYRKYPNLIKDIELMSSGRLWVSDITYIRTEKGFVYLSLVTDVYSKKIVGWCLLPDLTSEAALNALKMAISGEGIKQNLVHHSDRGIQYCCNDYVNYLKGSKIKISMTENGDPYENAVAERVNGILKDEWGFDGFTVSDYNSVGELIPHGVAADKAEATALAIKAGCDMDMMALAYVEELEQLVTDGKVDEALIDEAVRRILRQKFRLGLMDDPYLYFDKERRDQLLLKEEHRQFARDFATKTSVLLKNENNLLPLKAGDYQKIAVIGPLSDSREYRDYQGNWNAAGRAEDVVTLFQALQQKFGNSKQILQANGCEAFGKCPPAMIDEAVNLAKQADVIICAIGENGYQTGECASRADITLPGNQEELLQALQSTGKPVVMVMFNGRPLIINWAAEHIPAILEVWQPGIMGGPAIADLLFGEANPSGKLPISFPRAVGQIPVYYAHLNTGRPKLGPEDDRWGVSKYSDVPNEPLYPFGFGLSYTTFAYDNFAVDKEEMTFEDTFPEDFQARWIRFKADQSTVATANLVYE